MTKPHQIQSFTSVKQKIEYFNQLAKSQNATVSTVKAAAVSNAIQTPKTSHKAPIASKLVKQKQPRVQAAISEPLLNAQPSQSRALASQVTSTVLEDQPSTSANKPSSLVETARVDTDRQPKTTFMEILGYCELVREGAKRNVYISKDKTHGYKLESYCPTLRWQDCTPNWNSKGDLILNSIYSSNTFYGGRYSSFANLYFYETPGIRGIIQRVTAFSVIPGSEPLSPQDKIPMEYILNLRNNGFILGDIKPENFVKVKRPDGTYDLIPIDGKFTTSHDFNETQLKDYRYSPSFPYGTSFIHGLPFEHIDSDSKSNNDEMSVKSKLEFLAAYRDSWTNNNNFYTREITESSVKVSPDLIINIS